MTLLDIVGHRLLCAGSHGTVRQMHIAHQPLHLVRGVEIHHRLLPTVVERETFCGGIFSRQTQLVIARLGDGTMGQQALTRAHAP